MNRREVLHGFGSAAAALSLNRFGFALPHIGANDKLTIGCIGVGSQGLRVMLDVLRLPEIQVVSVCDVNRGSSDYLDWGPNELRNKVRMVLQDPSWGATLPDPQRVERWRRRSLTRFTQRNAERPTTRVARRTKIFANSSPREGSRCRDREHA